MYRAIAECATFQFKKCKATIKQLQIEAPYLLNNISGLSNRFRRYEDSAAQKIAANRSVNLQDL